jgi:hypothetical protein
MVLNLIMHPTAVPYRFFGLVPTVCSLSQRDAALNAATSLTIPDKRTAALGERKYPHHFRRTFVHDKTAKTAGRKPWLLPAGTVHAAPVHRCFEKHSGARCRTIASTKIPARDRGDHIPGMGFLIFP